MSARGVRAALGRWSVRGLIGSWVLYWLVLLLAVAGPALLELIRINVTGAHGSVSLSYGGSLTAAVLWLFGPPLLLAVLWLATRPARVGRERR